MNYFIGQNLGDRLTGIEKAQLNRLKLFESKKLKAKCVYTEYSGIVDDCMNTQRVLGLRIIVLRCMISFGDIHSESH